jgi:hypothetical protein
VEEEEEEERVALREEIDFDNNLEGEDFWHQRRNQ